MTTAVAPNPFLAALRALAGAAAGFFVVMAVAIAALAAAGVGVLIALAALALRAIPRGRPRATGPELLEGRRTAEGWVVETGGR